MLIVDNKNAVLLESRQEDVLADMFGEGHGELLIGDFLSVFGRFPQHPFLVARQVCSCNVW